MGLNLHFGYTGLPELRPGRRSSPSAPTASPMGVDHVRPVAVARPVRRPHVALAARPAARRADAAAAGRLPRHRHHRGRRDHPAGACGPTASARPPAARTASRPSPTPSTTSTLSAGRYGFGSSRSRANRFWVVCVGWALVALVALFLYLLTNSPWGRVLKSHPGGRGRRPKPRQERVQVQDAEPRHRRRARRPGRRDVRHRPPVGAAGQLLAPASPSSATPPSSSAVWPGSVGPDPRRDGVLVLIQGTDVFLRQAISNGYLDTFIARQRGRHRQVTCSPGCCSCCW